MAVHTEISETKQGKAGGVVYAVSAFLLWGVLPLYWKALNSVPAMEILMHRIVWSFVFAALLLWYRGRGPYLKEILSQRKKVLATLAGGILVGLNWGIYIWAVNANHVLDASLGYYINPLLSVSLGMLVLRERLNSLQVVSLVLAFFGVLIIAFEYGQIPWVALALAFSFATYGLVKKTANIESSTGLMLETAALLPLAIGYLGYLQFQGHASFGATSAMTTLLLAAAGIVTAVPLLWFAEATARIPLSTVGFIQYLTPTMMLAIGVIMYGEPFTTMHLLGFVLIWCALALFSLSQVRVLQRVKISKPVTK